MPLLITYQGKPVKRRRRVGNRLKLLFYAPIPGEPGKHLLVTQAEWEKFGRTEYLSPQAMPDVRRIAGS